jgi:hypothetical protein
LKCTKESESKKIPIDTVVKDDLNEFVLKFGSRVGPKSYVGLAAGGASEDDDSEGA